MIKPILEFIKNTYLRKDILPYCLATTTSCIHFWFWTPDKKKPSFKR